MKKKTVFSSIVQRAWREINNQDSRIVRRNANILQTQIRAIKRVRREVRKEVIRGVREGVEDVAKSRRKRRNKTTEAKEITTPSEKKTTTSVFHLFISELEESKEINREEDSQQKQQNTDPKEDEFERKYLEKQLIIPPDWKEARLYGQQSHIGRVIAPVGSASNEIESTVLGIRPRKEKYPLCVNYKNIQEVGSGVPMLYQFKLWTILIYCIILIPAIYSMVVNFEQGRATDYATQPSYVVNLSLGNFGRSVDDDYDQLLMYIQTFLHMAAILVIWFLSLCLKGMQKRLNLQVDEDANTPSDYAAYVRNIPLNQDAEQIKAEISRTWKTIEVESINMIYNVGNLIESQRVLQTWKTKESLYFALRENNKTELIEKGARPEDITEAQITPTERKCCCCKRKMSLPLIQQKIAEQDAKIDKYYSELDVDTGTHQNIGKAFVIFKKQQDTRFLDQKYDQSVAGKIFYFLLANCCCRKTDGYPQYTYETNKGKKRTKRIYISRAPEPTDVYWQNLAVSSAKRCGYMAITYFATLLCLGVVFAVSFGLNQYKDDVLVDYNKAKLAGTESTSQLILVRGVSFGTSIIVVVFNNILVTLIRKFSASERHETHTRYTLSVAFKLTVATFVNSAIIPIVVNRNEEDWFSNSGLVLDIYNNVISLCFVTPILYLADVMFFLRLINRCLAKRKGARSTLTQKQANELMEGPAVDMARRNSNTYLLLLITMFYAPLVPLIVPIALIGAVFTYWVDKIILLRRHKHPSAVGPDLSTFFGTLVPWGLLLYAFSNWFWVRSLSQNEVNTPAAVLCFVLLAMLLFPLGSVMSCCFKQNAKPSNIPYSEAEDEFLTNYDLENPVTRAQAIARDMQEHEGEMEKKQKSAALKRALLDSCDNYSRTHCKVKSGVGYLLGVGTSEDGKVCSALGKLRKTHQDTSGEKTHQAILGRAILPKIEANGSKRVNNLSRALKLTDTSGRRVEPKKKI